MKKVEGVKDIVSSINTQLKKSFSDNGISKVKAFGVSDNVVAKNVSFPVFFKANDGKFAGFDDRQDIIFYHKLGTATTKESKGYGDRLNVINSYNMTLVIYFDAGRTKLQRDEMFTFIQSVLPSSMKGVDSKFDYIRTSIQNSVLNSMQVFQQEYKGIQYSLKPEQSLIAISYQIESSFRKGCFNCCT